MTTSSLESPDPSPKSQPPDTSGPVGPNQKLLEYAWERHDIYSKNASKAQSRFFFVRRLLAYLSVAVVFLSVLQPIIVNRVAQLLPNLLPDYDLETVQDLSLLALFDIAFDPFSWLNPSTWSTPFSWVGGLALVDFLLILLPILATGLLAFAVKFDRGNNWVLLRGNSETLKMEIFYYRTQVRRYKRNRDAVLAEKLQLISERVKGSAVHQAALNPYEGQSSTRLQKGVLIIFLEKTLELIRLTLKSLWDFLLQFREVEDRSKASAETSDRVMTESSEDPQRTLLLKRFVDLDAENYIRYRIEDQFDWYRRKAQAYDRDYQILQTCVYFFGGLGTLLAAIGFQNWVAVSTSLAAALAGYLEYKRVEATLVGYNQAADALYDIRAWWRSLSRDDQAKPVNFEKLVTSAEETIRSEHTSWLQDMQDRLANLYGDVGDDESSEKEGKLNQTESSTPVTAAIGTDLTPPPAPGPSTEFNPE